MTQPVKSVPKPDLKPDPKPEAKPELLAASTSSDPTVHKLLGDRQALVDGGADVSGIDAQLAELGFTAR
jgi:hypothetical protein